MTGVNIKAIGDADIATASNSSYHVTIPIKITRRGRRKAVTLPDGTAFQPRAWVLLASCGLRPRPELMVRRE